MTTEAAARPRGKRPSFDKDGATTLLLAVLAGLGLGAGMRLYAPQTGPAHPNVALTTAALEAPTGTIVVVRRVADAPVARTRAS